MYKQYVFGILVLIATISLFLVGSAHALGSTNLVISHVQLGSATSASHEFIELYNNSSSDIEVTNWFFIMPVRARRRMEVS